MRHVLLESRLFRTRGLFRISGARWAHITSHKLSLSRSPQDWEFCVGHCPTQSATRTRVDLVKHNAHLPSELRLSRGLTAGAETGEEEDDQSLGSDGHLWTFEGSAFAQSLSRVTASALSSNEFYA